MMPKRIIIEWTDEERRIAKECYDRRAADGTAWDYTEWEELYDEIRSRLRLTQDEAARIGELLP